jgi:hypothetical protein
MLASISAAYGCTIAALVLIVVMLLQHQQPSELPAEIGTGFLLAVLVVVFSRMTHRALVPQVVT